jgi:hypothetical protein
MPTLVTVSQPANNEILVSSAYLQGLGVTSRLGESQIEHTGQGRGLALTGDIFFKFYTCNDSSGSKVYSALDVSSAISNATIENRFLSLLFTQYSNDAAFVADVGGAMVDIAERVTGSGSLTNNLAATLTLPAAASNPNYLEFVDMGLSSYFGATYINGDNNIANTRPSLRGTRVGQVHVTGVDPLSSPVDAKYDNSDTGCWQFSDYNTEGIIVYTNLVGERNPNFELNGLSVWSQFLCVYPILADIYDADYACIFNDLDSSFLRSGLGFFDRNARATGNPNFYGWAGNFLLSIFNDWGIPLVCPIWSLSRIAICAFFSSSGIRSTANFSGDMEASSKAFRWTGPRATFNVVPNGSPDILAEKNARSTVCLLYANECQLGSLNQCENLFGLSRQALGYFSNGNYLAALTASTTEGYNAHIYRYILESSFASNTPTNTRTMVSTGVSWSGKLASQPSLLNCFTTTINSPFNVAFARFYDDANSDFYNQVTTNSYYNDLVSRIQNPTTLSLPVIGITPLSAPEVTLLTNWLYTP